MLQEGSKWFTVNYQYASKIMLDVHKNYKKYTLNAKKLAIVNKSKFSLTAMNKKFESILDKYLPKFEQMPQAVNLKLPKLKKIGDEKNNGDSVQSPPKLKLPKLKKV